MRIGYHVTPAKCAQGILRDGLQPRDKDNFPSRRDGKPAVWIFLKLYDAQWWSKAHSKIYGRKPAIIRIRLDGIKLTEDTRLIHMFSSFAVHQHIPASKISLV